MEQICGICEEPLGERPVTELLCHHRYHSQCFFVNARVALDFHDIQCVVCHQGLLPDFHGEGEGGQENMGDFFGERNEEEEEEERLEGVEQRRIHTLWDTNAAFRKDVKNYIHACGAISKPRTAFSKLITAKKRELKEIYTPIKLRLQGLFEVSKDSLMNSAECKAYRAATNKSLRYYSILGQKYDFNRNSLYHLRSKPGCRRLQKPARRWRDSPTYMIRRGIYFRSYCFW